MLFIPYYIARVFPESVTWSSSCFSDVYLFAISVSYAIDEVHVTDIDGYFRNVMNESTSFASFAHAFKNRFSRLNEISRGCEKIVPVSESFSLNFKFSRMMNLNAWFWGWNVRVNGMRSVFSFWAVCDADCRSICWARYPVSVVQAGHQSRFSKNWHIATDLSKKSESSLHKRPGLIHWEKGKPVKRESTYIQVMGFEGPNLMSSPEFNKISDKAFIIVHGCDSIFKTFHVGFTVSK